MTKLILNMLSKMGKWFGIIFKVILPLFFMYRPIKTLAFSLVIAGTYFGSDSMQINKFGIIMFYIFYVMFFVLLLALPKVASATEFVLIAYYFAFWGLIYLAGDYSAFFAGMTDILYTYAKAIPVVLIFLAGKIFFFFFVRKNYLSIAQIQMKNSNTFYNPENY